MQTTPFFSVVIPVYNKGPYVSRAINSALKQSFDKIEVVVVCDPSTDKSTKKVLKFSDNPKVKIFYRKKPGAGGYAARNLGVKNSSGIYIAFLDADDEWNPDFLRKAHAAITTYPDIEILSAGWRTCGKNNKWLDPYSEKFINKGARKYNIHDYISGPRPIYTSVAIVKRELLIHVGGFDEKWNHGADLQLWFKLLLHANQPAYWINYCAANYYIDIDGQVTRNLFQELSPTCEYIRHAISKHQNIIAEKNLTVEQLKKYSNKHSLPIFFRNSKKPIDELIEYKKNLFHADCLRKRELYLINTYIYLPEFFRIKLTRYFRKALSILMDFKK